MNEDGAGRLIMDKERFSLTIERLAYTLMEEYEPFENICFVAIQPRGVILAKRLVERISLEPGMNKISLNNQPNGIYMVKIKQLNAIKTIKIIKQ